MKESNFDTSVNKSENELQVEQTKFVLDFLEKIEILDLALDKDKLFKKLHSLSFEDFKSLMIRLNGIIQGKALHEREIASGMMTISGFADSLVTPPQEIKEDLLGNLFEGVKKVGNNQDAALLLSAGLNKIHLFDDANGRLSRLLYILFGHNFDSKEELNGHIEKALNPNGRFNAYDLAFNHTNFPLEDHFLEKVYNYHDDDLNYTPDGYQILQKHDEDMNNIEDDFLYAVPTEYKKGFEHLLSNDHTAPASIAFKEGLDSEKFQSISEDMFGEEDDYRLLLEDAIKLFDKKDYKNILDAYYKFWKNYFDQTIETFSHPKEFQLADKFPDLANKVDIRQIPTLKDYFLYKVKETYQEEQL